MLLGWREMRLISQATRLLRRRVCAGSEGVFRADAKKLKWVTVLQRAALESHEEGSWVIRWETLGPAVMTHQFRLWRGSVNMFVCWGVGSLARGMGSHERVRTRSETDVISWVASRLLPSSATLVY